MNKRLLFVTIGLFIALQNNAEVITFADANVKAICITNWDANGDNELDTEEAAAVLTLGNVFRGKKNIDTFEELKYFIGLTAINSYAFYQSSIKKVLFPESVTIIEEYAFAESELTGELFIPGTIKEIGDYAFNTCKSVTRIVAEEGVETIGWHTFYGHISSLLLPASLAYISSLALNPYLNSSSSSLPEGDYLYVYSHSTTPAQINEFAFYYVFAEGHLVVPHGLIETYKAEPGWSYFGEYLEFGDIDMDGDIDNDDLGLIKDYVNGEAGDDFNKDIADTNGDGIVDEVDVQNISDIVDESTDISNIDDNINQRNDDKMYNLSGQVVGESYKGIVIKNGKKYIKR